MRNRSRKLKILMSIAKRNKIEIYKGGQEIFHEVFNGIGAPKINGNRLICIPENLLWGGLMPLCRVLGKLLHAMINEKREIVTIDKNFKLSYGDKSEFEKYRALKYGERAS